MHIIRLEAENVKTLRAVAIEPDGAVVQITGANGSGKSSVLDAMYYALAGKGALPSQPVREGEDQARIMLDLGELIVTRRISADGTTSLSVMTPDGAKFGSPQSMLDAMLGALTFDPLAFSRMKAKEQRDEIARLAGLTEMLDTLAGMDRADFDARTDVNRDLKQAEARLAALPVVAACEPVDVSATLAEIRAAREENRVAEALAGRREQLEGQARATREVAEHKREQARALLAEADAFDAQAATLDASAAVIMVPELLDLTPLEHRLEQAESLNAQHRAHQDRALAEQAVAELRAQSEAYTASLKAREAERAAVIAAADMPVPGLGLSADGVTLNGHPLDQASSAEQLRLATAIAMARDTKLRVLRIKDGSLLDAQSLAVIGEMAETHNWQVWLEVVDTSGQVGIVMRDGAVAAVHPSRPIAA